jgi:hypothetical protein
MPRSPALARDVELLVAGLHHDPHALLGAHAEDGEWVVRIWSPAASSVVVHAGRRRVELERYDASGVFEAAVEGAELGYEVDVRRFDNPRVEMEQHHYNAAHSKLLDLGLEPHFLSEELVASMLAMIERYKDRVIDRAIAPRTLWRPQNGHVHDPVATLAHAPEQ